MATEMGQTDESLMRRCFERAREAVSAGSHPFGALLAIDGDVVLEARNTVGADGPTAHAELNLVRHALATLGRDRVAECVLFTSTEPCAMCAGAIYWSRVRRVVFGCSVEALHGVNDGTLRLACRMVFDHGDRRVEVVGPVLEGEAVALHREFWSNR